MCAPGRELALYAAAAHVASVRGPFLLPLRAYWAPGVDGSCVACYNWERGLLLSSGGEEVYESDATVLHEAGHWAYQVNGLPYPEAGQHCLGTPVPPGMAFSEGHATWYASDLRRDSRYFSGSGGTLYHFDLERREPRHVFHPPEPSRGIFQDTNESWVMATLWALAKSQRSSRLLHEAMAGPELQFPVPSGYVGKYWRSVDRMCRPVNPFSSGTQSPILTDYLDSLLCLGYPEEPVLRFVSQHLPYDPSRPACK